jgi:type IV secretory pathway VirB2 component (pilin)
MYGNLAVILMVLCVVIVGLGVAFTGMYFLDRSVDQAGATPDQNPAE